MIPHCDELFLRYLDPWYDDSDRARRGFAATRPDMLTLDTISESPLNQETQEEVAHRIQTMFNAAQSDWSSQFSLTGDPDLHWIETIEKHYDRAQIKDLIGRSDPEDFSNDYLIVCCEFGALLGHVLKKLKPRLQWHYEWPYWESDLRDPKTNNIIPPFHWAVKKMSEYGVDDLFWEKVPACVSMLDRKTEV